MGNTVSVATASTENVEAVPVAGGQAPEASADLEKAARCGPRGVSMRLGAGFESGRRYPIGWEAEAAKSCEG